VATGKANTTARVGLLGGTFNPIHFAHLRCAEEVREALNLERVLFVPSARPPHKHRTSIAPAEQRLAMVRLAVARYPAFRASTVEVRRGGPSYSVDTVRLLLRRHPSARFVFILGSDAFREIGTWKEYETLFTLADIAVMTRPPAPLTPPLEQIPLAARTRFCYANKSDVLVHESGHRVAFLQVTPIDISASAIRSLVRRRRSIRYLVPVSVERYITRNELYIRRHRQP